MRLNDEGDDTQLSDGTANKQYFWSNTELLYYLNAAQSELYLALVNLHKSNELKNLVSSTTATAVPANCFAPFAATVSGQKAILLDDPRRVTLYYSTMTAAVLVWGNQVKRVGGAAHVLWYYKRPTDIAANAGALTEMTEAFYTTALDLAEHDATHKDNAQVRLVMRRQFGVQDIQYITAQKYLANAA